MTNTVKAILHRWLGSTEQDSINIICDTLPPNLTVSSPNSFFTVTNINNFTFSGTGQDNLSGIKTSFGQTQPTEAAM